MSEELKPCPCCHKPATQRWKGARCTNTDCMLCGMHFDYEEWQNKRQQLASTGGEAVGTVHAGKYASGMPWREVEWHVQPEPEAGTKLYTNPQPAPAGVVVPRELRLIEAELARITHNAFTSTDTSQELAALLIVLRALLNQAGGVNP